MHIKSTREDFMEDLDKTLYLLSHLMGTTGRKSNSNYRNRIMEDARELNNMKT